MFATVLTVVNDQAGHIINTGMLGALGYIGKILFTISTNHLRHLQESLDRIEGLLRSTHDNTIEIKARVK